jgi:streptogramin lyase
MRAGKLAPIILGLALAGCGGTSPGKSAANAATGLEGDSAFIAAAQTVSDAIGGCVRSANGTTTIESKVVSLEKSTIVMLACGQDAYSYTHRLFAIRSGQAPQLLALPDYDASGWYGSDEASMAELDAGTGVLTTMRQGNAKGTCGSEGRYQWNGARFVLQEMHWQDCTGPQPNGPPFPTLWPTQVGAEVDPNGATPAP